jgi:hypothetical protein
MSDRWEKDLFPLKGCEERIEAVPVTDLLAYLATLDGSERRWGSAATAATAQLGRLSIEEWMKILAGPRLLEARLWNEGEDLHWLAGRGLLLRTLAAGELPSGGASLIVDGGDWLTRDRKSRLWGEWLDQQGAERGWYEQQVPDVLQYGGVSRGPDSLYVFILVREYVRGGLVQHVRFRGVEGGTE